MDARDMQRRPQTVGRDVVESLGEGTKHRAPGTTLGAEPQSGLIDRPVRSRTRASVQWMRVLNLRPAPGRSVSAQIMMNRRLCMRIAFPVDV
jgi:hypothetical protein